MEYYIMDKMTFGWKNLNAQRPLDRFIAPRDSLPEIRRRVLWERCEKPTYDADFQQYQKQKKYRQILDEAFNLKPLKPLNQRNLPEIWPCAPRKETYLSSNDSLLLDLPMYSKAPFPDLLDWSDNNILVAAQGRNYHMWSWQSQSLIRRGFALNEIYCCKFDPKGKRLLLGTIGKSVEIHDSKNCKRMYINTCNCHRHLLPAFCCITAIDWSPTGNSFVTGCSRGTMCVFTCGSELITSRHPRRVGTVLAVKVSPDARHVAAATVNEVTVFTWPDLKPLSTVTSHGISKTLAWHPWRSSLLGMGNEENSIGLWNVPSEKTFTWNYCASPYILDAMLFSHRTGEMVLSLWNEDAGIQKSQLVVLSDPLTVVDQSGLTGTGLDRVRTMVFSPDGTKLATATTREDLIIWNFLAEGKNNKKRNHERFTRMPVLLDVIGNGRSFR